MAINREDIIDIDLDTGSITHGIGMRTIGEGDNKADIFGVRVLRSGNIVDLTGITVTGFFIRPDGTTVTITGGKSGSVAYVQLPEACYYRDGDFRLSIKLTGNSRTVTVRVIDGTILDTAMGALVDPGGVIPDLDDFETLVGQAEDAAETVESFSITATQIAGTRYKIAVTVAS